MPLSAKDVPGPPDGETGGALAGSGPQERRPLTAVIYCPLRRLEASGNNTPYDQLSLSRNGVQGSPANRTGGVELPPQVRQAAEGYGSGLERPGRVQTQRREASHAVFVDSQISTSFSRLERSQYESP